MKRIAEAKLNEIYTDMPLRLPFRSDLHLARKVWHLGMGLIIGFCYLNGTPQNIALIILGAFLLLGLFLEAARLHNPLFNEKVLRFFGPIMRNHEVGQMCTATHYLTSVMVSIAIFPKPIAVLSILYLACGDPVASLVGILYGHLGPKFKSGKSWIGTAAGISVCAAITFFFLKGLSISSEKALLLAMIGGIAGGTAELLPFDMDDNFTIPIISGFVLWLAFMVVGV